MRTQFCLPLLAVFALGFFGCGSNPQPVPSMSSVPSDVSASNADSSSSNQRGEIVASWNRFVSTTRSRIPDAESHFRERWKGSNGEIQITLASDDVTETSSLKYTAEGKITLRSTERFGGITRKDFTHNLRFGYSDGKWSYIGGNGTNPERDFNYPELTASYHRVLFP